MDVLRSFIRLNRRASDWLARTMPKTFGTPSPCYFDAMSARVAKTIAEDRPGIVLEAGGVDRPMMSRSPDYRFVGLDIDEQPDCATLYDDFIVQSIEEPVPLRADLIVSLTLLEHVPNNRRAIKSMFDSLRPGGSMHHYVPSGFHPYSLALRLVGPKIQKALIPILRPGAEDVTGYPAFFDQCSPGKMEKLLHEAGFRDIKILPYYRANDYFAFFTPLFVTISLFEDACSVLGIRLFSSGFVFSATRPKS